MKTDRRTRIPSLILIIVPLLFYSAAQRPSADPLTEKLQAKLDTLRMAGMIPGVTAAIAFGDGNVIGLASGYADTTSRMPMTSGSLLMQGSIGKTYVSAVALQLVHEGKIDLDAKVSDYLGEYSWYDRIPNARDMTVRMLMNHSSGVMRYEFKEAFTRDLTTHPDKTWKPEELVAYVLGDTASFAAGKDWEYSDTNYILLGMIIEKVTGSRYYDELRSRILEPHALRETVPVQGPSVEGLVQGYAGARNEFGGTSEMIHDGRMVINPQFEWTGGGIASTSVDLAKWGMIVHEGSVIDASLMQQFLDGVPAKLGPNATYGLGVILRTTRLGPMRGHSGFFPGYMAEMYYFPEQRFTIAVQINTSDFETLKLPPGRILFELAQIVAQDLNGK